MDILLDFNYSLQTAAGERIDISIQPCWSEREGFTAEKCDEMLTSAFSMESRGLIPRCELMILKDDLETHVSTIDAVKLDALEQRVPHIMYRPDDAKLREILPEIANNLSDLTPAEEEEYYNRLDQEIGNELPVARPSRAPSPVLFSKLSARDIDRELEFRDPLSVHNWLKKHHVVLQDTDDKSDTGTPTSTTRKSLGRNLAKKMGDKALERAKDRDDDASPLSASTTGGKFERDTPDEDITLNDEILERNGKSKDAGDDVYRPKGSKGGGKAKRKRDDGEPKSATSSKKPRTSVSVMED